MKNRTLQLTLSACFIAMGVGTPILFHQIGLGRTFMPMFWPMEAGAMAALRVGPTQGPPFGAQPESQPRR